MTGETLAGQEFPICGNSGTARAMEVCNEQLVEVHALDPGRLIDALT